MGQLKDKIYDLKRFTKSEEVKKAIDEIGALLLEENQFNLEANIETGDIDSNEINIGEMTWGDDYEVTSGSYVVDGEEYTEDERQDGIDELEEEFQNLEDKKSRLHGRAYELVDDKQRRVNDELEEFEDAEFEYDEIMWNTVWNYGGYIDHEIARRLGFGILEMRDGTEYMFLQGCGMDLSPMHVAYQALKFGYIDSGYVRKFRDVNYFKYVVGEEVFKEVCEVLGITHCIETAIEDQKQRMKEFDEKIEHLKKLRDVDPVLGHISALVLMAQTIKEM